MSKMCANKLSALFVTPVVVLIGWILKKEMSLYFTIFETISLFVSAFIVNFLVLDGRSNYLEGALLCAAYVIIGWVLHWFFIYPPRSFKAHFSIPLLSRSVLSSSTDKVM